MISFSRGKLLSFFALIGGLIGSAPAPAQSIDVSSTNGYVVHVFVTPVSVNPVGSSCAFGYSYTIGYTYSVSFSGSNIPTNLYTLQGNIQCGSTSLFFSLPTSGGSGSGVSAQNYTYLTNCASATPASLSCMSNYELTISGPGINNQTLTVNLSTPLPIRLNSFDGRVREGGVQLAWTCGSEDEDTRYELQRSSDAREWISIASVKGKGQAGADYVYIDAQAANGMNYYRIAEVDKGALSYSKIVGVPVAGLSNIALYPNPSNGTDIFVKGLENPADWTLHVYGTDGANVYSAALAGDKVTLPSLLPAGIYFVKLANKVTQASVMLRLVRQ